MDRSDIKRIIRQILREQMEVTGVKQILISQTNMEYFRQYFMHVLSGSKKLGSDLFLPITTGGYNDSFGKSVIFEDYIISCDNESIGVLNLVSSCYHELRHGMQRSFSKNCYEGFIISIEDLMHRTYPKDYNNFHDSYYFEIDANLYGVINAKRFIYNNFPELYSESERIIRNLVNRYYHDLKIYDPTFCLDVMFKKISLSSLEERKKIVSHFPKVMRVFMTDCGEFKSISQMLEERIINFVDKKIVMTVITSRGFLNSIDFDSLDSYEFDFLYEFIDSVKNSYNVLLNSLTSMDLSSMVTLEKFYLERLEFFDKFFLKLMKSKYAKKSFGVNDKEFLSISTKKVRVKN